MPTPAIRAFVLFASSMISMLSFLCGGARAGDLETARGEYIAAVRDKITAETLDGLDMTAAKAAIDKIASIVDPQALDILMLDAEKVAKRIGEYAVKLEKARMTVEQATTALKELQGQERADAEQKVKDAEKDLEKAKQIYPQLRAINAAITEGLLKAIDVVGKGRPDDVWDGLLAGLKTDMSTLARLDETLRTQEADLKSTREKLAGAKPEQKKDLETKGAELAGKVESGHVQFDDLDRLRKRRIETLSSIFASLEKAHQGKVVADVRAGLRDDAPPETRMFYAELIGALPLPDAFSTPLAVMKKASDERDKVEKELVDLREKYERVAKAVGIAAAGGHGQITIADRDAELAARNKLQAASNKSAMFARLVAAAARGLGRAIAAMSEEDRQKAANEMLKLAKSYNDRIIRSSVLAGFTLVKDDKIAAALRDLAAKDPEINTRLAALDALATMGDPGAVDLCADTLLKDADWRIRAAAMRVLAGAPSKKGIAALIASLSVETGRLIEDAEQALFELTGKHFSGDANLWKDWWAKNEATYDPTKKPVPDVPADVAKGGEKAPDWRNSGDHVSFYGITTKSARILFVLDRSGSMNEAATDTITGKNGAKKRIEVAKFELTTAITALKDGEMFNIIHFSSDVDRWQKTMQKSSAETRKRAATFIDKEITAVGGTNIYDALREAFRLAGIGSIDKAYVSNVDTIFFLTDGEPTQGEVTDGEEILRRVREWNKLSRVVIHAVGVGKDHNAAFLRRLAEENGGQYVSR